MNSQHVLETIMHTVTNLTLIQMLMQTQMQTLMRCQKSKRIKSQQLRHLSRRYHIRLLGLCILLPWTRRWKAQRLTLRSRKLISKMKNSLMRLILRTLKPKTHRPVECLWLQQLWSQHRWIISVFKYESLMAHWSKVESSRQAICYLKCRSTLLGGKSWGRTKISTSCGGCFLRNSLILSFHACPWRRKRSQTRA